jgi:hypothetical protein
MEPPTGLPAAPTLPKPLPGEQTITLTRAELAQLLAVLSALRIYIVGQLDRCRIATDAPAPP